MYGQCCRLIFVSQHLLYVSSFGSAVIEKIFYCQDVRNVLADSCFLYYQPHLIYSSMTLPPVVYLYIPGKILGSLSVIWLLGFVLILGSQIFSHLRFVYNLKRNSRRVDDPLIFETFEIVQKKINYTHLVELRYCSMLDTPLSVGMRKKRRITYLPEEKFTEEELEMIFSHELHHIQRNDTHTKFFLRFCIALG